MTTKLIQGDSISVPLDDDSVDLVFCSPPYEAARTYGIGFKLKGDEWVQWAADRYMEHLRVCKGLVAWVVEGQTRQFQYSCAPILLMAELHKRGVKLRKPPIYKRNGIPGSGGPDWLRNDYEFIVCGTKGGRLAWSDNTAMGHPPKYAAGGAPSHRTKDGRRVGDRPDAAYKGEPDADEGRRVGRHRARRQAGLAYKPPKIANPGNVIDCGAVGGSNMGSKLAHENEAPFPEKLAEFFIKSFCPPGGTVLDPFGGSGTTIAAAIKSGRNAIGMDIRESQIELMERRIEEAAGLAYSKG